MAVQSTGASLTRTRRKWSEVTMIGKTVSLALSCLLLLPACGGSKAEPESPGSGAEPKASTKDDASADEEDEGENEAAGPMDIPTSCHKGGDPCTADPKWVRRLCSDVYPAVALFVFQEKSPFTRGYISARQVRAVNASGGVTSGEEYLQFDEEVVLLHYRPAASGGIQVSGAGDSYEAMRLDGSCVTLGDDEVRTNVPPKAKFVKVPWRFIGDDMQNALLAVPAIKTAYIARRTECKGAFSGTVTDKCIKRDEELDAAILSALKTGEIDLPQPQSRP